ncbi:hypothetical protein [Zhihengliuella halotolerans]|uniref:hypothetical protein n=1 Tax=Zhihengliuella halotolerans TaxID=370736 RepID=UPI0011AF1DCD|nr:hypothetical protein [Zhihengliuella halotolerans]
MSANTVHNPLPVEVVFTSDGRTLAGHTTATAPRGDKVTERLLRSGRLITPARRPDPPKTERVSKTKTSEKEEA